MIWNILKRLISNPMSLFVYSILAKWYLMVTIAAIVVTFWVFKGLEQAGLFQYSSKVAIEALSNSKSIARYCTPKIGNIKDFWDCIQNPPTYEPTAEETSLEDELTKDVNNLLNSNKPKADHTNDPYDEK